MTPSTTWPNDLSIVVVSFNTAAITRDCLMSVQDTLGSLRVQVIVVDNASEDNSADMVANEFPWVDLIRNNENMGFAAANNQGFERCTGEFVLLLNSDTVVLGNVLADSVRYMREHADVGVFGCRVLNPDRTMQPTCFMYPGIINSFLITTSLFRIPWPRWLGRARMMHWDRNSERDVDVVTGCYLMVRVSAMSDIGLLDERFFFNYEETDWCTRFRQFGWRVRFAPVGEIVHIGNASGRKLNHHREIHMINGKVFLHRKHSGLLSAFVIWCMAYLFWLIRIFFWSVVALISIDAQAALRRTHAARVLRSFPGFFSSCRGHIASGV